MILSTDVMLIPSTRSSSLQTDVTHQFMKETSSLVRYLPGFRPSRSLFMLSHQPYVEKNEDEKHADDAGPEYKIETEEQAVELNVLEI